MLLRLVLDTSILISALRSRTGASAAILELLIRRRVTLLMNYTLACEYRDVALRAKHVDKSPLSLSQIEKLISALELIAEPVHFLHYHRPLSLDPDDNRILDVAINGRADLIVTTNLRHLREPALRFGIKTMNASDALFTIRQGGGHANVG